MSFNPLGINYLTQEPSLNRHKILVSTPTQRKVIKNHSATSKSTSNGLIEAIFNRKQNLKSHMLYTNEGYLVSYTKRQGKVAGRSCIVFPQGIIANCSTIKNQLLNGWAVICKKELFYNLYNFQQGRLQGEQYSYDKESQLMVISYYKEDRLHLVKQGYVGGIDGFFKSLKNKQLMMLINDTLNGQFFHSHYPGIQFSLGNYYGQLNQKIPSGLGILITEKELFYGNFQRGLLNRFGTILFQDDSSYVGDVKEGIIKGAGMYINQFKQQYKYYETAISKQQFVERRGIAVFQEIPDIFNIFHPIIILTKKLKSIYLRERLRDYNIRVTEGQMGDQNEKNVQKRQDRVYSMDQQQANNHIQPQDMQNISNNRSKNLINKQRYTDNFKDKTQMSNLSSNINDFPSLQQNNTGIKGYRNSFKQFNNSNQQYNIAQNIQQQDFVNRQSSCLTSNHKVRQDSQANLTKFKKDPLNSRINYKNSLNAQFRNQYERQKLQDQMVNRIVQKK